MFDIPDPCNEDKNKMKPVDGGVFCSSCNKKVHDFTSFSGEEMKTFFQNNRGEKICGSLKTMQLLEFNFEFFFLKFRLWNAMRRAAVVIFFSFGFTLFSCSGNKGVDKVGDISPPGTVEVADTAKMKPLNSDSAVQIGQVPSIKNQPKKNNVSAVDTPEVEPKKFNHPPPLPLAPVYKEGKQRMLEVINENKKMPTEAAKNKISGSVWITFKVTTEGSIRDLKVQNKLGYGCDEEALRVVKLLKDWKPGKQAGKVIEMDMAVEVKFP
jgi:TonB family protein